ncbi:MAG: sugar phosphate isomerase/epimerase family protein [Opitutales bacterium]
MLAVLIDRILDPPMTINIPRLRFALLTLLLCLASQGLLGAEPNPLGTFSFDIERLGETPEQRVNALAEMGYTGLALSFQGAQKKPERDFIAYYEAARSKGLQIYTAYLPLKLDGSSPLGPEFQKQLRLLKKIGADPWISFREIKGQSLSREQLLRTVNEVADACARAGVRCVIYPHYSFIIETVEDAVSVVEALDRKDIYISFHLCHEIRAGNGGKLKEVAKKVEPYLYLTTISGADVDYESDKNWMRTIRPLDSGDYDVSQFIEAIQSIDYTGPIILHTWGLQRAKEANANHHSRSIEFYKGLFR